MTHSNHRRGNRESLMGDWVILVRGDTGGQPDKMRELVRIFGNHNPVGLIKRRSLPSLRFMRNWKEGLSLKDLTEDTDPPIYVAGVYEEKKDVEGVIHDLKIAELGLSIVVSGVFEEVFDICKRVGTGPHTVNLSMGTLGKTELLPEDKILEVMTMCGHSLVGEPLISHVIDQVRKGRMTTEEAGLELGKQCVCNFFNPVRASNLIKEYLETQNMRARVAFADMESINYSKMSTL